jgi:hypothetical protein
MEVERRAVGTPRRERGGDRRGLVDHEQVARAQRAGQVVEAGVDERLRPARDHQAHAVPRPPARLGRLGRLQRGREREGERAAHACAPASERAA